jgi:hypothetical protein
VLDVVREIVPWLSQPLNGLGECKCIQEQRKGGFCSQHDNKRRSRSPSVALTQCLSKSLKALACDRDNAPWLRVPCWTRWGDMV